jgi:type III secretion system IpaD/SipD/SspD family effector
MTTIADDPTTTTGTPTVSAADAATTDNTQQPRFDPFARWLDILGQNKANYVDVYIDVMQKYTGYMADIADLVTAMANATTAGSDKDHVNFNGTTISAKLNALRAQVENTPLFTSQLKGADALAEATAWAKELGLDPDKTVRVTGKDENGQETYGVFMDATPIVSMINALKNGNLDIPSYQAMQAAFDAQKQVIQNTVQVLAEKFSKANGNYDSYVKAASATLEQLLAILKGFL